VILNILSFGLVSALRANWAIRIIISYECFVLSGVWAFTGFYFVAVSDKEAIMTGNMIRLAKARTPLCGVFQKGHLFEVIRKGKQEKERDLLWN
jgi:hypothetical protein